MIWHVFFWGNFSRHVFLWFCGFNLEYIQRRNDFIDVNKILSGELKMCFCWCRSILVLDFFFRVQNLIWQVSFCVILLDIFCYSFEDSTLNKYTEEMILLMSIISDSLRQCNYILVIVKPSSRPFHNLMAFHL